MHTIEELSMNALPSLQTVLYDGWVIRFADGYTNRANSVNPLYPSSKDVHKKIEVCETLFRRRNLKPTYKITPAVSPQNLDSLLEARGYGIHRAASVQILSLNGLSAPDPGPVLHREEVDAAWLESYCRLNHVSEKSRCVLEKMLGNILASRFYTSLYLQDDLIACGMAVLENGYMGLFDITVDEKHRNSGHGTRLLLHMLSEGKIRGAENAYLQVMQDNTPALRLYEKIGFREMYRYHYRVLTNE